jgi:hypothetical protein
VAADFDPKPTIEALEEERRRLKELERNLAAERDRIQANAGREIALMQEALRDAAERAKRREQELETARRRLDRKLEGGRLARLAGARERRTPAADERDLDRRERELAERELRLTAAVAAAQAEASRLRELEKRLSDAGRDVEEGEALAGRTAELTAREDELDRKLTELVDTEWNSFEHLAARRAELDARAVELERREAELSERGQAPPPEPDVRAELERLEAKAATLEEGERKLAQSRAELTERELAVADREAASAREQASLEERSAQVAAAEEREAELADRATLLAARESELAERLAELEQRQQELSRGRAQLDTERRRLAGRTRRLAEAERRAPIEPVFRSDVVGFSEGLRALARRRGAPHP